MADADGPVYVVGGAVRDILLGRPVSDLDLAASGSSRALAAALARDLDGVLVALDEDTKVYRVVLRRPGEHGGLAQVDVAAILGKDIEEDLGRRDFTANAMAIAVEDGPGRPRLIDPRGGGADLARRRLRADEPRVFKDDPLRLLRAFRLAAQLGFTLDKATLRAVGAHRRLARRPAGERIRTELLALLAASPSHTWLRLMDACGLLTALFPELEPARRCAVVYYGKGGVLRHTLDAVERMDFLLARTEDALGDIARDVRRHFDEAGGGWAKVGPLLRLGVLLHDIAKPPTARRIGGRLRFFGHDSRGARMSETLMKRLRFSKDETAAVSAWVRHHLRPGNLAANPALSDRAVFRFFSSLGPHAIGLLLVCWADHASYLSRGKLLKWLPFVREDPHGFDSSRIKDSDARKTLRHLQVLNFLLTSFFRRKERVAPPKLLDGDEVMRALGIAPGPAVGKALSKLQEAQAEGKVKDRSQALEFLKKIKLK